VSQTRAQALAAKDQPRTIASAYPKNTGISSFRHWNCQHLGNSNVRLTLENANTTD
jgi:hypothetical protein